MPADTYSYARARATNNVLVIGVSTVTTSGAISANSNQDVIMASSGSGVYTVTLDARFPTPTSAWFTVERSGATADVSFVITGISGQVITIRTLPAGTVGVLTTGDKVHVAVNCLNVVVASP